LLPPRLPTVRFRNNCQQDQAEGAIRKLPDDQQELIKIKRKYDLSDNIYNTFLQKEVKLI
jgi:uncharacterized protein involved in exopolysaccharide biosynthesis